MTHRLFSWLGLPSGVSAFIVIALILNGCQPLDAAVSAGAPPANGRRAAEVSSAEHDSAAAPSAVRSTLDPALPSPFPPRPLYSPGELVDYTAQTGDTLPNLAVRFNTTVAEIKQANLFIPDSATSMPPGMPIKIPIYYLPLWGSPYQIIPDSLFVNGPTQVGFDTANFIADKPGWLKDYSEYAADANRSAADIIDYTARYYSVSPRLLLALLEYQAGALSQPSLPDNDQGYSTLDYPLGYQVWDHKRLFMQLGWAANLLNNGYYGYRTSHLTSIEYHDGRLERFDPWQNAATVSLHNYFNFLYDSDRKEHDSYSDYAKAISSEGFAKVYRDLFGDPWQADKPHIPGSLTQPEFSLPFEPGYTWAYTGGPHTGWGIGEPYAAVDFAPPSVTQGCQPSSAWVVAMAPGVVARSETGIVVLDLDGDGDERTGWDIFYLHIGTQERAPAGATLKRGDPIGHPSCEGGESTGTHVHIARKYNGEWIPADSALPLTLDGWVAHSSGEAYQGTLTHFSEVVTACECSNRASFIQAPKR
jgi:murein DD-endopeptidase MepM/ murein hydrolase activator NlpD